MSTLKDYEEAILAGEKDIDEMKNRLAKLKNVSEEDKTEVAMLRSRIDEQSSLIMMLKKRSDEHLIRSQALDKANEELIAAKEVAEEMLNQECQKTEMLDRRFFELADNHEEMIRLKDYYKQDNERLKKENQFLAEAVASQKDLEKSEHLKEKKDLTDKMEKLQSKYDKLEEKLSVSESLRIEEEKTHKAEIDRLKKDKVLLEQRCKQSEAKALIDSENEIAVSEKLKEAIKEKDEYLQLAMQRGRMIQEKQQEIINLKLKVEEAERKVKEMQRKFEEEAAAVNVNVQVRKLREALEIQERKAREIETTYEAFKEHSNKLLASEKELNARLRNLMN